MDGGYAAYSDIMGYTWLSEIARSCGHPASTVTVTSQCSADKGIIAGIVLVTLVIIGCFVGLCIQPAPEPGDTTKRRITFSSCCVCMWMCPLICLLSALTGTLEVFHLVPASCLSHENIMTLKPEVMPYFLM